MEAGEEDEKDMGADSKQNARGGDINEDGNNRKIKKLLINVSYEPGEQYTMDQGVRLKGSLFRRKFRYDCSEQIIFIS